MNNLILGLFFIIVSTTIWAQKESPEKKSYKASLVQDSMMKSINHAEHHFYFPELNKKGRYFDRKKLENIQTLQEGKNQAQLIIAYEEYISHFRTSNFSQDTDVLWKLAQLYEVNKMLVKAKSLYRLVLKHHRKEKIQEIQQYFKISKHYDELTELERHYYVPLDYYYELLEYRKKIDTLTPPKSVLLNMGPEINENHVAEYAPSINFNDKLMIFTKRLQDKQSINTYNPARENLYYSLFEGYWEPAIPFPKPIQSKCNEGSATMTTDGKTIFFTRCIVPEYSYDCPDCIGDCDIFEAHMQEDSTWSIPVNLGENINSVKWESQPYLTPDEDTLYFVSDRTDGFGMTDIYYSVKDDQNTWGKATNMGPIVNTRGSEFSPFESQGVFYFASNGQILNLLSNEQQQLTKTLDIYKVYRSNDYFLEPINIGPLVNGSGNESYFSMDKEAKSLYYAKTEEDAANNLYTDLFSFPVPMTAQPMAKTHLSGTLTDSETGNPYQGIVSIIDLENGIEVAPREVRKDGSYEFDLIDHNRYLLVIQGDDFFRIERLFELEGDTAINIEAVSVANRKLRFTSIEFENGKADILKDMEDDLWDVINFMVDNPGFNLTIGGHTDSDGNEETNRELSQERADAIKYFLEKNGQLEGKRITAIGYGDTQPIKSPEVTDEDKRINRRVEFNISRSSDKN